MTGSRLHETRLPRRTIVQPVQLSLLPYQVKAPPTELIGQLPGSKVEKAIMLFFEQKTAYEVVSGDWSSDVCSSDLAVQPEAAAGQGDQRGDQQGGDGDDG